MTSGGGAPAFAAPDDVTIPGRPLVESERPHVQLLLDAAARWIRRRRPDIADDDPDARYVSIMVVRDAISAGKFTGHLSYSKTVGPWAKSGTLVNPDGALRWTDEHKEMLGIPTSPMPRGRFGDWR